jgi:ankyrin repeat protein
MVGGEVPSPDCWDTRRAVGHCLSSRVRPMLFRKNFMLVELLLVIAMIGILIALLLPARTPSDGLLHRAAWDGNVIEAKRLLDNGLSTVDERGNMDNTPLHRAAYSGNKDVAALLIKRGANINAKNRFLSTPLHEAVRTGHVEVVRLLVANGADLNAETSGGSTPLDNAGGDCEIAAMLITKGAKRSAALKSR